MGMNGRNIARPVCCDSCDPSSAETGDSFLWVQGGPFPHKLYDLLQGKLRKSVSGPASGENGRERKAEERSFSICPSVTGPFHLT